MRYTVVPVHHFRDSVAPDYYAVLDGSLTVACSRVPWDMHTLAENLNALEVN
jgi:hypothetical protein